MIEFEPGDAIRYLPCMHTYHMECIDDWLMRSFTCPSCMEPVDAALLGKKNFKREERITVQCSINPESPLKSPFESSSKSPLLPAFLNANLNANLNVIFNVILNVFLNVILNVILKVIIKVV